MESSPSQADIAARANIGRNVIYFSLTTVGVLGLAAIVATVFVDKTSPQIADRQFSLIRDTFTMLLPVLGTWVGTVLAFYFSRENFAEAAHQTANLVRQLSPQQRLEETPVLEAMISLEDMSTCKLTLTKPEKEFNLHADLIAALFDKMGKNRLPVLDTEGRVKYIIHRSMIDKYISGLALAGSTTVAGASLADLVAIDAFRKVATAFGTVAKTTKLIAVKNQIDGNPDCADVFVTEDGTRNAKAIGWITNVIVAEKSQV